MKSVKGSKTEQNLLKAFAGESQARNRYTYFASKARDEGFEQIAALFIETADNEKEHAKRFFSFLEDEDLEITASYPAGKVGSTKDNLKAVAHGENFEYTTLYPGFAKVAEEEGYPEVAVTFKNISIAEKAHEQRYLKLSENLEKNHVFKKDQTVKWKCRNCGWVIESKEPPETCPSCLHPKKFFEIKEENY